MLRFNLNHLNDKSQSCFSRYCELYRKMDLVFNLAMGHCLNQWFSTFFRLRHLWSQKVLATHNWWKTFNISAMRWNKTDNVNIIKLITLSLSKSPSEKHLKRSYYLMWRLHWLLRLHWRLKYFLATHWRISATHKCVATPGLRTTGLNKQKLH